MNTTATVARKTRAEDAIELYGKLLELNPTQLQIVRARVDQILLDQQEIKNLRKQLEVLSALLAERST